MRTSLDWISNRDAHEALVHGAGRSNLLQSWAWGEAKQAAEGWIPRRAVIAHGSLALDVVQVLEKRVGPARIARINRGPLWLLDDLSAEARTETLAALRRCWPWWRGAALLIAPEWPAAQADALHRLGLRPRRSTPWHSAWVDLFRPQDELRKSLNGKWRNMLVGGEKAGLEVTVMTGAQGVEWLMPRYEAMLADKGFAATPPALLRALAAAANADDLLTLAAHHHDGDASAVLVARHGAAATYLIGWNSDVGRKTRGNHLLLWRAMLELKDRGCRWLDLGGIDEQATPGIAQFKRGLNGEEYVLAGEYLSF